jgi:hypothetical protein
VTISSHILPLERGFTYVTQENVKAALDSMLYASEGENATPLENTWLVDQVIGHLEIPPTMDHRTFALHTLLISLITGALERHRQAFDIVMPGSETSLSDVWEAIRLDVKTSNPELIAWSWLYYRFVRVEFNISPDDFCRINYFDKRTLRRYQHHAIWRLTQQLIAKEFALRRRRLEVVIRVLFGTEYARYG